MTQRFEALALATRAHAGQVDKAGLAYIDHPVRVAERLTGRSEVLYIAGLLHDTVEDTFVTLAVITEHFGPEVAVLVDAVTKREGERKPEYYARVKAAGLDAVALKMADIADNTDPDRLAHLPAELRDRLTTKYAQAVLALR